MSRIGAGRARSAPKLFHDEAAAETPSHGPKPWAGILHNGTEVEFMRIEGEYMTRDWQQLMQIPPDERIIITRKAPTGG